MQPADARGDGPGDSDRDNAREDGPANGGGGLADRDLEILTFERQWWKHAGAKEQAIREHFDMSSTRYYQLLSRLIDRPRPSSTTPCS